MAVSGKGEKFDVKLQHRTGWLGATATGTFGNVEGWIRIDESAPPPAPLAGQEVDKDTRLWGRTSDGAVCRV